MPPRLRVLYVVLTVALLTIPLAALYREFGRSPDIWSTPLGMAVPLPDSKDRVEIYVRDAPRATLLEQGHLSVTGREGSRVLNPQEIRLRFNNWDRVRAARLPLLLVYAAGCGFGIALLLVVATGRLAYRGGQETVAT